MKRFFPRPPWREALIRWVVVVVGLAALWGMCHRPSAGFDLIIVDFDFERVIGHASVDSCGSLGVPFVRPYFRRRDSQIYGGVSGTESSS